MCKGFYHPFSVILFSLFVILLQFHNSALYVHLVQFYCRYLHLMQVYNFINGISYKNNLIFIRKITTRS